MGGVLCIAFDSAGARPLPRSPWRLLPVCVVADERVQLESLPALGAGKLLADPYVSIFLRICSRNPSSCAETNMPDRFIAMSVS